MADYLRVGISATYSENSDYSDPETQTAWTDWTETPDEYRELKLQVDTTPAVALDVSDFATVSFVAIRNTDDNNFVTVVWTDSAANANTQKLAAGRCLVIPDIDPSATFSLQANNAAVVCKLLIAGT